MSILDAHTHFFSYTFFETLARSARPDVSVEETLAFLSEKTGIEIPDRDTGVHTKRWLEQLDEAGIERAVCFASVPEEAACVSEAAKLSDGRLIPYLILNPTAPNCQQFAEKALDEMGYRGFFFFPALHHYHFSDEICKGVLELAQSKEIPLLIHCGILVIKIRDILGLPQTTNLRYANPVDLVPVANAYPDIRFILPHFGCGFFRETLMLGSMCNNVYVDTSSSNNWMQTQAVPLTLSEVFKRSLDVFGSERILFGTDSSVFPRGWRKDILQTHQEVLKSLETNDADMEKIFGGNAKRLLGL